MEMSKRKRNTVLAVMMVGAFISSLSQSLLTSALPSIMKDFEVTATVGQWLTTIYILVLGVVTCITAYLINKYNTKNLFILAMLLFLIGCIISIFAPNFPIILFSRVIQACGAGILQPLMQVTILKAFSVEQRGKAMGIMGFVVGFAPAIGPTVSGLLADAFGWKSIFYLLTMISIVVIIAAKFALVDIGEKIEGKMDFISAILYGIGFCGFMLGVTNQEVYGWVHYFTLLPIIIGIACLCIFVIRQLKLPAPLLQLRVFHNHIFSVTTVLICIAYIAIMSGTIMVPIYIQSVRRLSAVTSGLVLFPGSIFVIVINPIAGYVLDKYGARIVSVLGMIILTIGTAAFTLFGNQTSLILITTMYCLRMIGTTFLLMPLTTYGISALDEENISHGTAIVNSIRQMAGALGSSILVAIMVAASSNNATTDIHGFNVCFGVQTGMIILGLIGTLVFIKNR